MQTIVGQALHRAADILETHEWIRGRYATTRNGHACQPTNPDATCFCMMGAIVRAAGELGVQIFEPEHTLFSNDMIDFIQHSSCQIRLITVIGPIKWNDTQATSKEQVVAVLRKAAGAYPA